MYTWPHDEFIVLPCTRNSWLRLALNSRAVGFDCARYCGFGINAWVGEHPKKLGLNCNFGAMLVLASRPRVCALESELSVWYQMDRARTNCTIAVAETVQSSWVCAVLDQWTCCFFGFEALEAIKGHEMVAELPTKHGLHPTKITARKVDSLQY